MKTTYIIIFSIAIVILFLVRLIRRYNNAKAKGRYGSFWGCSSYPKCRYTLKR